MNLLQNRQIGPYLRKFSTNSPAIHSQICEYLSSIFHFFLTVPQARQAPSRVFDVPRTRDEARELGETKRVNWGAIFFAFFFLGEQKKEGAVRGHPQGKLLTGSLEQR
jgi:hypothetical protein